MDLDQEKMQFLGICGVFREAIKIIKTERKIFTQITLALILPLSFFLFTYIEIFNSFSGTKGIPEFKNHSEKIYFLLFNFISFIFFTTLSLLATSAVIYTVACIYTARDITFKHIMSVVPKVWKRLLITFLCVLAANLGFIAAFSTFLTLIFVVVVIKYGLYGSGHGLATVVIISSLFMMFYFVVVLYFSIVWQLSSVVSVLEDFRGFKAMAKSKALVKGKMMMARNVFVLVSFPAAAIQVVFKNLILESVSLGVVSKDILGIACLLSFPFFSLLTLVTETVFYFVCKSYHREKMDKSSLSDHLQVYVTEEYAPLKAQDAQVEIFQVV